MGMQNIIFQDRAPDFFDSKMRSENKYKYSKVLDRLATEIPRCPFILNFNDKDE